MVGIFSAFTGVNVLPFTVCGVKVQPASARSVWLVFDAWLVPTKLSAPFVMMVSACVGVMKHVVVWYLHMLRLSYRGYDRDLAINLKVPQSTSRSPKDTQKTHPNIKPHKVFLDVDKGQVFSSSKQVKGSLAEEHCQICQRKYHPKAMNVSKDLAAQQKKR